MCSGPPCRTSVPTMSCCVWSLFSCVLRLLTSEITRCFHYHNVHNVTEWYTWLDTWSRSHIVEANCTDPFNNVNPKLVVRY